MLIQLTEITKQKGRFEECPITIDCSPGVIHTIQEITISRETRDGGPPILGEYEPLERKCRGITFRNGHQIAVKETQYDIERAAMVAYVTWNREVPVPDVAGN